MIDTVRFDVRSGGDTATRAIIAKLDTARELHLLRCAPSAASAWAALAFSLANVPAPVFVLLGRLTGGILLEFFNRASLLLLVRCLWAKWAIKPDIVLFNHHSSFVFSLLFPASRVGLIWHDVPAHKKDSIGTCGLDSKSCAALQSRLLRPGVRSFTFSLTEARLLRRLHGADVSLLPAIAPTMAKAASSSRRADVLLLVGNWHRPENRDGAAAFLEALAQSTQKQLSAILRIIVAGAGAESFLQDMPQSAFTAPGFRVVAVGDFEDLGQFDACALVAPILRGAGIKIKTLEAWSHSIPVLGTPQAFTGIAPAVWKLGGLRFSTIPQLVEYCRSDFTNDAPFQALSPARAMDAYLRQSGSSLNGALDAAGSES